MFFQALLLALASTTSFAEPHLAETQRHIRVEDDSHKTSAVELSANGHQVAHKPHKPVEPLVRENIRLTSDSADASKFDADETHLLTPQQWKKFEAPSYPCLWNVQISRLDKGSSKVWRTIQVKGESNDNFHFRGCTTEGEEAFVCQNAEGAQGGVRLMRNAKDEVVGFGSCCKAAMVDEVMAARMGTCDASWTPPVAPGVEANSSAWMRNAADAIAPKLPPLQQSGNMTIRMTLLIGSCLLVAVALFMFKRYHK